MTVKPREYSQAQVSTCSGLTFVVKVFDSGFAKYNGMVSTMLLMAVVKDGGFGCNVSGGVSTGPL